MKKLLWVLILLLLPLTAWAEDAEIHRDGAFFYQIADGEATLTGCDWDAMQADSLYMFAEPPVSLEIPATLGGCPVTSIGGGGVLLAGRLPRRRAVRGCAPRRSPRAGC